MSYRGVFLACADVPDRWEHVAAAVPRKSTADVRKRYQRLLYDIARIEAREDVVVKYRSGGSHGLRQKRRMSLKVNVNAPAGRSVVKPVTVAAPTETRAPPSKRKRPNLSVEVES